jgi:hypothetical protein
MTKAEIAEQYRKKYPGFPTLKLARIIYNENKLAFKDVEQVRSAIRYIEGKVGTKKRKVKTFSDSKITEARPYNPYSYPQSEEVDYKPEVISGYKRIGILNDVHLPYHNIEALTKATDKLKKVITKEDAILLNGDIIDAHRLSRFVKDPKKRDFKFELDTLKAFFDVLDKTFGCQIIYKLGNHEDRYQRFLYEKMSELSGIEDFEFSNIIKARERGIRMVEAPTYMKFNDLIGLHGHEFGGGGGELIARTLYLKGTVNAFQGHNHRTDTYIKRNPFTGETIRTYGIGCLSELHPAYSVLQKNPWNYGYAWVELDSNGKDFIFNNEIL